MLSQEVKESFLSVLKKGIGHDSCPLDNSVDWNTLKAFADEQGLSAVVLNAVDKLPVNMRPKQMMLLTWIGEVLQAYEQRYELYKIAIAEIGAFYNDNAYKMMVLKGYACCLDWPMPEHRPCGDIDIWLFGKQKEADALMTKELGMTIDTSHHHHTVFNWNGFMVENHYDFINVHHHKSHMDLERVLKDLGSDDSHYTELHGVKVYLPSPNLHALFLLKHIMLHFASEEINFRQVLDWAFFVEKHTKEIDWEWLEKVISHYGMESMYNIINAICVDDLGFDASIFPTIQFLPELKERVLNDILDPEFSEIEKGGIVRRAFFKYRRWRANAWKHKLCFNESMSSAFWSGVKSHLLKPSSI